MPYLRFRKPVLIFGLLLMALAGFLSTGRELARAHARYERSEPAADAVIPEPPAQVQVWFTEELFRREGANTLEVFGPDGVQMDQGDSRIDDDDRKHMLVSLQPALPNGRYTVRWKSLSADDGDADSGEFNFTVDPEAGQVSPVASPTTAAQPAAEPAEPTSTPIAELTPTPVPLPSPTPQARSGLPCFSGAILGGLLALVGIAPHRRQKGRL